MASAESCQFRCYKQFIYRCCWLLLCVVLFLHLFFSLNTYNFHGTYGLHEEVSAIVSIVFNKKYVLFLFLMVLKYSFAEHKNTEYYYLCLFTRNIYRPSHTHMLLVYDQSDYELLLFFRSSSYALSRCLLCSLCLLLCPSAFNSSRQLCTARLNNICRHKRSRLNYGYLYGVGIFVYYVTYSLAPRSRARTISFILFVIIIIIITIITLYLSRMPHAANYICSKQQAFMSNKIVFGLHWLHICITFIGHHVSNYFMTYD